MTSSVKTYICILFGLSSYWANANNAWSDSEKVKSSHQLKFESYPADIIDVSSTPKLKLHSKHARQYKTMIAEAASEPANFAGHYRVATWGCGTDCHGFAILNKLTGDVYTLPSVNYVVGVMGNDDERIAYKPNSRLLVLTGTLNDDELSEGQYFYVWKGEMLIFLKKLKIVKEDLTDNLN